MNGPRHIRDARSTSLNAARCRMRVGGGGGTLDIKSGPVHIAHYNNIDTRSQLKRPSVTSSKLNYRIII
jgi:hypothetical protein